MKIQLGIIASLYFLLLLSSCYKEDPEKSSGGGGGGALNLLMSEKVFDHFITERNFLIGRHASASDNSFLGYDLTNNTYTPLSAPVIFDNYSHVAKNEFYTCLKSSNGNEVDVYNVLDGSKLLTYNYSYLLEDCAIANNKIYTIESTIGPSKLHVYNLSTNVELASTYVGSTTDSIVVSSDGKRIFTFSDGNSPYNFYSLELTSSNQLKDIKVGAGLYPFAFSDSSFSMSTDGKRFITDEGDLYNDSLKLLHSFSPSSFFNPVLKFYITPDAQKIAVFTKNSCFVFNATTFDQIETFSLPQAENPYFHVIPFYYNGRISGGFRYFNSLGKVNTMMLSF